MLFELEEGTSRKFYRIELHGTRVHLHWGRIGTEGDHLPPRPPGPRGDKTVDINPDLD